MPSKKSQKPNVSEWVKKETPHVRGSLETASRHFDRNDALDVHTLESMYGQESTFGQNRRNRNSNGAAGDFQMDAATARRMGLHISKKDDERFDLAASSAAAAKYLKSIDNHFRKESVLTRSAKTTPIQDAEERKKFDIASYNAGESRIARAQKKAIEAGDGPTKWDDVEKYLEDAGATEDKADEIREYVDKVLSYENEFQKKSPADDKSKFKKSKPIKPYPPGEHWVTIDGRHVLIKG
jgi:membrane-bound lytic murein transglycosylase MltF